MMNDVVMLFQIVRDSGNSRGYLLPVDLVVGDCIIDDGEYASGFDSFSGGTYCFPDASLEDSCYVVGFPISIMELSHYLQRNSKSFYNQMGEEIHLEHYSDQKLFDIYKEHITKYLYTYQILDDERVCVYQIDLITRKLVKVNMRKDIYNQKEVLPKVYRLDI